MAASITTSATTLEGQLIEIVKAMQVAELAIPEATRPNRVTIDADYEASTLTVTGSLQFTLSGTAGAITVTPVAYLP